MWAKGVSWLGSRRMLVSGDRFSCFPLLNRDCGSVFEVRCARGEVLSLKNMAPSLEGGSNLRSCVPGVSPLREGAFDVFTT